MAILAEYNYLRSLPVARALYDNTRLSEKAERHRDAPRPEVPDEVADALRIDDDAGLDRLETEIGERKANTHSVDDQVRVATAFADAGITPDDDGIKRTELRDVLDVELEYQPRTVLDHLVDAGILEQMAPGGPDVFAISERRDEIRELLVDSLPAYWALYIHSMILGTNKAPRVYGKKVLSYIEEGEEIRRPYPKPEVNNQRNSTVLKTYSESQEELIETGEYNEGERSSGHNIGSDSFSNDNEGAILKNFIKTPNTASNTLYQRMYRKYGFDSHPARFPKKLPQFFVNLLTPDPPYSEWERGDRGHPGYLDRPIVLDIFGGSNWTGKTAEDAGRYWLSF